MRDDNTDKSTNRDCPVCEATVRVTRADTPNDTAMWKCGDCGVTFSTNDDYVPVSYDKAYSGTEEGLAEQIDYSRGVEYSSYIGGFASVSPMLTGLELAAKKWLLENVDHGAPILDLGCGTGRFLMALSESGFDAYGVDVARPPIEVLRDLGYSAAVCKIDSIPNEWPSPMAIVCLEVLEHVPEPLAYLRLIKKLFPQSHLLLGVPFSDSRSMCDAGFKRADAPPNHLTRWTDASLSKAIGSAGYLPLVRDVHVTAGELSYTGATGRKTGEYLLSLMLLIDRVARKCGCGLSPRHVRRGSDGATSGRVDEWRTALLRRCIRQFLLFPQYVSLRLRGGSRYWLLAVAPGGKPGD